MENNFSYANTAGRPTKKYRKGSTKIKLLSGKAGKMRENQKTEITAKVVPQK